MESGVLMHIITAKNIRWLHTSTREVCCEPCLEYNTITNDGKILYAYEDEVGNDVIASLDFWQTANGGRPQLDHHRS